MDEARPLVHALCSCSVFSCVIAFATCVIADKCSVLLLITERRLYMGIDEARALVHALCSYNVSPVSSPLLHA